MRYLFLSLVLLFTLTAGMCEKQDNANDQPPQTDESK